MKNKQFILLTVLLSTASLLLGQEEYKLTFTTDKNVGDEIRVSIHADAVIRPQIWIDLNNDGIRDIGEDVKTFDQWRDGNTPTYTLGAKTVTIYGRISQFGAEGGELTSIDFSNASDMVRIWLADNKLETIDLSAQTGTSHINILRLSGNRLKGSLDFSHLPIRDLRLERNNLESVKIKMLPQMTYLNVSRNFLTEESINNLLDDLGTRVGYSSANFYVIDTSNSYPEYIEGNHLKQHHLTHPNLSWSDNVGMNWFIRDVNSNAILNDISTVTDIYNMSFSTNKTAGSTITLNIDADESDQKGVWIDLNDNNTKDIDEQVTTFGSNVTYTIASQNVTVYGPVKSIVASGNQLTEFNSIRNSFLTSLEIDNNNLSKILVSPYQQLENLNIAMNNFTASEIDNVIATLINRTSMSPGSLTLIDYNLEIGEDGNTINAEHIMKGSAKNWIVKDASGRELLPTDIGNIFNWLEMPAITIAGNNAIVIGAEEDIAQFTKFYVNGQPVQPIFGRIDISDYTGNIELKITNDDGSRMLRIVTSK